MHFLCIYYSMCHATVLTIYKTVCCRICLQEFYQDFIRLSLIRSDSAEFDCVRTSCSLSNATVRLTMSSKHDIKLLYQWELKSLDVVSSQGVICRTPAAFYCNFVVKVFLL